MILRAANLVFATTNSYAVERLIEERGLFDWTIVEEAGKATGLGRVLAPRFQPCTLSVGGAAPSAARVFLFAQFTGGAGRATG